ncbi:MAG: hypothetical protein Q8S31_06045 [Alphaproteobacteria bacterium]|nr:hypothetical protein [Alphaproteobacteria bacterium]
MAITPIPSSQIQSISDLNIGATRDINQHSGFGNMVSEAAQSLRQDGHAYEMESAKSIKGAGNEIDLAIVSANLETSLKAVRETLSTATATFKEIYHIQAG